MYISNVHILNIISYERYWDIYLVIFLFILFPKEHKIAYKEKYYKVRMDEWV